MKSLKFKNRRWDLVHRFEQRQKVIFLKKLTVQEGFEIFSDLYDIASRSIGPRALSVFVPAKLKTLSRIHSIFNKVIFRS